ncbi:MAG: hypothetical protein WDN09_01210 [bacterium]
MKLKNLDFRTYVFGQSGVQGFYGGYEYPHQKLFRYIPGYSYRGMGLVAKTITAEPRTYPEKSNTPLKGYKLTSWLPKSIWVSIRSFFGGYMLNAMGIPNEGAKKALERLWWQPYGKPFQISFAPEGKTVAEKVADTRKFCNFLKWYMPFNYRYAIQVNLSCPNTEVKHKQDTAEAIAILSAIGEALPHVRIIPKFDLLVEPETVSALKHYCDAFCIGNSLPFGRILPESWWKRQFPHGSPLEKRFKGFSGGLSGAPLFPLLVKWLKRMQAHDSDVIIIAGGGIMQKKDILRLSHFGIVHGIALGAVATLRPWRLQSLIDYGNKIFSQRKTAKNERDYAYESF